jgi:membrane protease YdiL (CAAX protease family)
MIEAGRPCAGAFVLAAIGAAVMTAGFRLSGQDLWSRLILCTSLLGLLGAPLVPRADRTIRWPAALVIGIAAAALLYAGAWGLTKIEVVADQARRALEWKTGHSRTVLAATLPLAVIGEELFWRGAVLRRLARTGPRALAVALGALLCGLAHLGAPGWILPVAAFATALAWGSLCVWTRGLAAPIVCHYLWDAAVMVLAPPA